MKHSIFPLGMRIREVAPRRGAWVETIMKTLKYTPKL